MDRFKTADLAHANALRIDALLLTLHNRHDVRFCMRRPKMRCDMTTNYTGFRQDSQ
jgi:hypothetical protein